MRILSLIFVLFAYLAVGVFTNASAQDTLAGFHVGLVQGEQQPRLQALNNDIMGDQIDPNTGVLTFEHVDISIPGNSNLEVAIRRSAYGKSNPARKNFLLADWSLDIPSVSVTEFYDKYGTFTNGIRICDGKPQAWRHPDNNEGAEIVSSGLELNIPGQAARKMLVNPNNNATNGSLYTTKDHWRFECIENGGANNKDELIGYAPNGDMYKFELYIPYQYVLAAAIKTGENIIPPYPIYLAYFVNEVRDVNGNWVKYEYDGFKRLTRIHSNDKRVILVDYGTSKYIQKVTANGRSWNYKYGQYKGSPEDITLEEVAQPDGRSWHFNLGPWSAKGPDLRKGKKFDDYYINLVHPYGARGKFLLSEIRHGRKEVPLRNRPNGGDNDGFCARHWRYLQTCFETASVVEKTLSGPNIANQVWKYDYQQDTGHYAGESFNSGLSPTKKTTITDPLGRTTTYIYDRVWGWRNGQLLRTEQHASINGVLLGSTDYTYIHTESMGEMYGMIHINKDALTKAVYPSKVITQRDGDTFTTEYTGLVTV